MAVQTSYDLPNYVGELFLKSERPNALLNLIGNPAGPNGGQFRQVGNTEFAMGVNWTTGTASQPSILEGAAPTDSQFSLTQTQNVLQIFQKSVDLSYSLQGRQSSIAGVAVVPGAGGNGALIQPGSPEFQIQANVQQIAREMNLSFLRGAYQKPTDNTTARRTRGIRTAVTTNVAANSGTPRALTKAIVDNALLAWADAGMFTPGATLWALCPAAQMNNLIALFEAVPLSQVNQVPGSQVAGLQLRELYTRMAKINVVYEFDMPAGEILFIQPEKCRAVTMPIPGKGTLFVEPIAKTGASDKSQIYGEWGIDYTDEIFHGLIDDLS
jgi:hypothetical protein